MNSLLTYGSDDDLDDSGDETYVMESRGGGSRNYRKPSGSQDDTNYDEVQMSLSEDSDSEPSNRKSRDDRPSSRDRDNIRSKDHRRDSRDDRYSREDDRYSRDDDKHGRSDGEKVGKYRDRDDKGDEKTSKYKDREDRDEDKTKARNDDRNRDRYRRDRDDRDSRDERKDKSKERDRYSRDDRHGRDRRERERDRRRSRSRSRDRRRSRSPKKDRSRSRSRSRERTGGRGSYYKKFDRPNRERFENRNNSKAENSAQPETEGNQPKDRFFMPGITGRFRDQIEKRKLLWQKGKEPEKVVVGNIPTVVTLPSTSTKTTKVWEATTFAQDTDGKVANKFKRLMGIKTPVEDNKGTTEVLKKQEEMFSSMEAQYEVARTATHTMRGVGLGFGSYQR